MTTEETILKTILDYKEENGWEPPVATIARLTGYTRMTVYAALRKLEKKGKVKQLPYVLKGNYEVV